MKLCQIRALSSLEGLISLLFYWHLMAHIPRHSISLLHSHPGFGFARFSSLHRATSAAPSNNPLNHPLPRSTREPSLIVFDAPSRPSENLTRRSAHSPTSLSDYYSARRRLVSHSSRQVRSSTSDSVTSAGISPLNSVIHPENTHARIFDTPSKPREYYTRAQPKRDLPELKVCRMELLPETDSLLKDLCGFQSLVSFASDCRTGCAGLVSLGRFHCLCYQYGTTLELCRPPIILQFEVK